MQLLFLVLIKIYCKKLFSKINVNPLTCEKKHFLIHFYSLTLYFDKISSKTNN